MRNEKLLRNENLQPILWSKSLKHLDFEKDKNYIIHQILMYGDIAQIKRLLKCYSLKEVRNVFVRQPKNIYTPAAFNFIKNIILGIKKDLDEKRYVKTLF